MAALDSALPECFWKRKFVHVWRDHGLDAAYAAWSRGPVLNHQFIPQVKAAIKAIKDYSRQ